MAEPVVRVELTASFLDRLAAIESFLTEADTAPAYDPLLSIRHHRELSFQFDRLWEGPARSPER